MCLFSPGVRDKILLGGIVGWCSFPFFHSVNLHSTWTWSMSAGSHKIKRKVKPLLGRQTLCPFGLHGLRLSAWHIKDGKRMHQEQCPNDALLSYSEPYQYRKLKKKRWHLLITVDKRYFDEISCHIFSDLGGIIIEQLVCKEVLEIYKHLLANVAPPIFQYRPCLRLQSIQQQSGTR